MDNFIINSIIAGIGIALITGLLGCFVVWRKMSYFGESLGHGAILGVGAGIILGINQSLSIILVILIFAALLTYLQNRKAFSNDTILGILAHGALAMGIILISVSDNSSFNLHAFLFGDILLVGVKEIYLIFFSAIIIYAIILCNWKAIILSTISKDLARSQNISNFKMDLLLTTTMALAVAISIQIIGALLITSMLIIPPATAKQLARNPKNMVIISTIIAILSVLAGLLTSYQFDIPSGPAIILSSFILFIIITFVKKA
jgi:zinc transport system permease protein